MKTIKLRVIALWGKITAIYTTHQQAIVPFAAVVIILVMVMGVILFNNTFVTAIFLVIVGFALGLVANGFTIRLQFGRSTAKYRLDAVKKATKELLAQDAQRGQLRSKYRYSMGVIIDILRDLDKINIGSDDLPALTTRGVEQIEQSIKQAADVDGWALYDRYVRLVVNDISPYVFANLDLQKLANFCTALETVVSTLDAALEPPCQIKIEDGKVRIIANPDDVRIGQIRIAYANLKDAWSVWCEACGIPLR